MSKPYTVVVIFEAKQGKANELQLALETVAQLSRGEKPCLEYRLHRDVKNPNQFILYENWTSKEEHKEHLEMSYIIELAEKLDHLLDKPYQAIFAEEICN